MERGAGRGNHEVLRASIDQEHARILARMFDPAQGTPIDAQLATQYLALARAIAALPRTQLLRLQLMPELLSGSASQEMGDAFDEAESAGALSILLRVADASGNGFAVMDADGSLTYANRPLCRLLDEPEPEAVIGRPMIAYLPESWHATFQRDVLPAVLAEGSWVGEVPVRSRVGAVTPTMQAIFVVQRGPRQAMRIAARAIDISERRRLEETLRASEERYRELVETIDEVVFAVDAAGVLVYISSAVRQLLGHAPEDGLGQSVMRFVHPDDHAVIVERMRRRAEGEDLGPHEYRLLHADGSVRYARISTHPIRRDGRLVEFRGTMVDVHARRMAEEALRESESRYAALVEQAQVGVAIVQDGVIEYCNQYCAAMVGGTPQEFIGRPLLEFIAPEDRGAQDAIHRRRMRGDETAPLRYQALGRHRDGSTFRVENIATRILYRGRPAALVVIRYASEEG